MVLKIDLDVCYGVGFKFIIKFLNVDFIEFKEFEGSFNFVNGLNIVFIINFNKGDSIIYCLVSWWVNVKVNENNVWILNDGCDSGFILIFRLILLIELEFIVIEGVI